MPGRIHKNIMRCVPRMNCDDRVTPVIINRRNEQIEFFQEFGIAVCDASFARIPIAGYFASPIFNSITELIHVERFELPRWSKFALNWDVMFNKRGDRQTFDTQTGVFVTGNETEYAYIQLERESTGDRQVLDVAFYNQYAYWNWQQLTGGNIVQLTLDDENAQVFGNRKTIITQGDLNTNMIPTSGDTEIYKLRCVFGNPGVNNSFTYEHGIFRVCMRAKFC